MRKELVKEIAFKMFQDPGSELCGMCADYFGMPAAEFAEVMRLNEASAPNYRGSDSYRSSVPTAASASASRNQILPLGEVFDVINRRGRHSEPRVLHIGGDSLEVPKRSREFGGGWQFVMLRVVAECLGQGLPIPWFLGTQLIVAWDPGNMTNPKVVKWSGKDLYISTNRSGPNIVDICNSMCIVVGLDPNAIRVEFTFEDKH